MNRDKNPPTPGTGRPFFSYTSAMTAFTYDFCI